MVVELGDRAVAPAPTGPAERLLQGLERRWPPAAGLLLTAVRLGQTLRPELRASCPLPWGLRLRAWRHGLLGLSWVIGELEGRDLRAHVNDVETIFAGRINGPRRRLLNDKLAFVRMLAPFPGLAPRVHAVLLDGRFLPGGDGEGARDLDELAARLAARGPAVLKPADSSLGHGVHLLEHDQAGWRLDGHLCPGEAVARRLSVPGRQLVQERARQHPYAAAWFPATTNSLRLITMWDPRNDEPFVAVASQRVGTRASFPVDNISKGGLWCFVSVPEGKLSPFLGYDHGRGRLLRPSVHPDTGVPLRGEVPGFPAVVARLLEVARAFPDLPFVGWDVVITEDGFRLIEGNNIPGLAGMGPLLGDERVRRFLSRYGVLAPWRRRGPAVAPGNPSHRPG